MNMQRFARKVCRNPSTQSWEKGVISGEEHAGESDLDATGSEAKVGMHALRKRVMLSFRPENCINWLFC